jgi:ATP-binding cassette subfamily F protein uup
MAESLISGNNLSLTLGGRTLFTGLGFSLAMGEKVGIIGANGVGKSSLCKMILGTLTPEKGQISKRKGLKIGYLSQTPEVVAGKSILETLIEASADPHDWENMALAHELFSKFGFEPAGLSEDTQTEVLSGGWRKKLALATEIMKKPDLLILDEPTNHLDVESILWLEDYLFESDFTYLAITHDRAFLDSISNVIWEMDPRNRSSNGILRVEGNYAAYCEIKEIQVAALQSTEKRMSNTLRRETEWLRRGPKARSTKQNARIERAYELQDEVADLKALTKTRKVGISFQTLEGTPKKLVEIKNLTKAFGGRTLLDNFNFTLERGQKLGLIGANGSGKSTLIKLIMGTEKPDKGEVIRADALKVAYFDQNRAHLDPKQNVLQSICPEGDYVKYQGNFVHARGYLERFLFGSDDLIKTVSKLSGGEQARLLIARLMLIDCNLLILDEPTNDLDIQTLNVLEDELRNYPGALIIVSHDRFFLDQVADFHLSIFDGKITQFADVHQWERWMIKQNADPQTKAAPVLAKAQASTPAVSNAGKLKYSEKIELEKMESEIAKAEKELADLQEESLKTETASDALRMKAIYADMATTQEKIDTLYKRWSELDARK